MPDTQSVTTAPAASSTAPAIEQAAPLGRAHARRLREVYRSAGWPCQDLLEVELLAAGLLVRVVSSSGHECVRVSDAGLAVIAACGAAQAGALSADRAVGEWGAARKGRAGRVG